ncbi:MAG: 23S rRNA (uracil(1939)-C(5))-methyltransferase RlmD, partial [Clostridia bacterium]
MKKNETCEVEFIDNGYEGEGICKIGEIPVFVPYAIKGEKATIKIVKVNKNFAFGKIEKYITQSDNREQLTCPVYGKCGGCNLLHMKYSYQLALKKQFVENSFRKEGLKPAIHNTIGLGIPFEYRNKVQYPVSSDENGKNQIGFYAKKSHNIVPNEGCCIQDKEADNVAKTAFNILTDLGVLGYNEITKKGTIRHIIIRRGYYTGEVMCVLVINKEDFKQKDQFIKTLLEKHPEIKTVVLNINKESTNKILGEKNIVIYGDGYITDTLGKAKYKISASSFYQVNSPQAEAMYEEVKTFANLTGKETVLDMYAGVGTIGIFLARDAKKVYGIEIVEEAVEMANKSIEDNKLTNCEYIAGDAGSRLKEILENKTEAIDVTVVDPPRKGLDDLAIEQLLNTNSKKIIYVSCNPATLARDVKKLSEKYEIKNVQP